MCMSLRTPYNIQIQNIVAADATNIPNNAVEPLPLIKPVDPKAGSTPPALLPLQPQQAGSNISEKLLHTHESLPKFNNFMFVTFFPPHEAEPLPIELSILPHIPSLLFGMCD